MNCRGFEGLMFEWLDGRVNAAIELRLRDHAEWCSSCRQALTRWQHGLPALRDLEPDSFSPLALRRIELAVERELAAGPATPSAPPARWGWRWGAIGALAAVATFGVWFHLSREALPAAPYGRLDMLSETVLVDGHRMPAGATLSSGGVLEAVGPAELTLGRAARARVTGAARLALLGDARALHLRLERGQIDVTVGPRKTEESFAVETPDGHVEVRGTRFSVGFAEQGSWVRVAEGHVAAFRAGDAQAHEVNAGQTFWLAPEVVEEGATARAPEPAVSPAVTEPSLPDRCATATARARSAMRAGDPVRALHLVEQGRASISDAAPASLRCRDELGYLRAEALRVAGRLSEAIAAYRRLDRPGAPPAMRQNALFVVGELEQRTGRHRAAHRDFTAALAAAPAGALREEAMARAMEVAWLAHDEGVARAKARRYLGEYPTGLAARRARRILAETADVEMR